MPTVVGRPVDPVSISLGETGVQCVCFKDAVRGSGKVGPSG